MQAPPLPRESLALARSGSYLAETPQVQQAIALGKGLSRKSGDVVRGWQLYAMVIVCDAAAAHFARESSFEHGHTKELTALETQLILPTRVDLGEQMMNLSLCLTGDV